MHFPKLALFALLTPAFSLCTPVQKRADLLQTQSYADFQISDGVAGNALAEVAANFPVRHSPTLPVITERGDKPLRYMLTKHKRSRNSAPTWPPSARATSRP